MSKRFALSHSGDVFRQCRQARGLSLDALTRISGLSTPTASNIELRTPDRAGVVTTPTQRSIDKYIGGLADVRAVPPLTEGQQEVLKGLYRADLTTPESAADLAHVGFDLLKSARCPAALREMVAQLGGLDRPALLLDPLWHIHAINGLVPEFFEIDENAEILRRWEGWHDLGIKLHKVSPVLTSYPYVDNFLGHTLQLFFLDPVVLPYHFTWQMQAVIERVGALATEQGVASFPIQWKNVTSLMTHFDDRERIRTVRLRSGEIQAEGDPIQVSYIELLPGVRIPFLLLSWRPVGQEARAVFEVLRASHNRGRVLYAADYDQSGTFHVNTWPPELVAAKRLR